MAYSLLRSHHVERGYIFHPRSRLCACVNECTFFVELTIVLRKGIFFPSSSLPLERIFTQSSSVVHPFKFDFNIHSHHCEILSCRLGSEKYRESHKQKKIIFSSHCKPHRKKSLYFFAQCALCVCVLRGDRE